VRVMLVDDNRLMLEGLQNLLEVNDIQVAGLATNGREAIDMARQLKPDVILMDIRMPHCDGLTATRLIKAEMPEARIIILTTSTEDQDLFEAVKSGAYGYLLKSMDTEELVEALEQVQQGTPPFSPGLAAKLLEEFARVSNPVPEVSPAKREETANTTFSSELSQRQIEVLKLVSEGLPYKEVGSRLNLSARTIKYHMAEIMDRLHLDNRAQVLAYAGQMGWKPKKQEN
jgi:DNA-binding NarL/FixJ family response regulator